jgi:hypothetical protein
MRYFLRRFQSCLIVILVLIAGCVGNFDKNDVSSTYQTNAELRESFESAFLVCLGDVAGREETLTQLKSEADQWVLLEQVQDRCQEITTIIIIQSGVHTLVVNLGENNKYRKIPISHDFENFFDNDAFNLDKPFDHSSPALHGHMSFISRSPGGPNNSVSIYNGGVMETTMESGSIINLAGNGAEYAPISNLLRSILQASESL